jgi:hypothetical protein
MKINRKCAKSAKVFFVEKVRKIEQDYYEVGYC